MTLRGCLAVVGVETVKLTAQIRARLGLAACVVAPFVFAAVIRMQSSLPEDTLFGRAVKESGFAVSLVVLGFGALWTFPVIASIVGGDLFSAEDRYGTWTTVLTRSCSRAELFVGKTLTALAFSLVAVTALAVSSVSAGLLAVGTQPIIDLSGLLLAPAQALSRLSLAWLSVVLPAFSFTALAILASVATRSSIAGIGLPVAVAMIMQLYALVDGPEVVRRLMMTTAFGAWHGLFTQPQYYAPLLHGTIVSVAYVSICLAVAYRLLQRRDIGGAV
jgi:ABC-2 type transport system permease protein